MAKIQKPLLQKGDIVTVRFNNLVSSNTFIVDSVLDYEHMLLMHPLFPKILLKYHIAELNSVSANIKDCSERSLDFANNNKSLLDYDTTADLEALCAYFVVKRKLTPRQKRTLSNICGKISLIKLNDNVQEAKNLVNKNKGILDEFNMMWYKNFEGLFSGRIPITSKKQRDSIFNMAGFVMAELETPGTINPHSG